MKIFFLIIAFSVSTVVTFAQSKALQGIWRGEITSDPESNQVYMDIINQPKLLSITLDKGIIISIGENLIGFISEQKDSITEKEFNNPGNYFCICNSNKSNLECIYPSFDWADSSYHYSGTDVFEYYKVRFIPNNIKVQLNRLSRQNKRDYLFDYLDLNIKIIKAKGTIYSRPHQPTKMYLIQNDPVEVVQEQGDWLKIKYYPEKNGEWTGKTIEGWIKKTDVE